MNTQALNSEYSVPSGRPTVAMGEAMLRIFRMWQSFRRRQGNLEFLATLDGTVLQDVGLSRADIAALCMRPLALARRRGESSGSEKIGSLPDRNAA